jgi:CHAT domain-containing protein
MRKSRFLTLGFVSFFSFISGSGVASTPVCAQANTPFTFSSPGLKLAAAKPDPLKLPLAELLQYAEFLRKGWGYMSANSVLIMAEQDPKSVLSDSDRAVVRNQIALYSRQMAQTETESESEQLSQAQFELVTSSIQSGHYADAIKTLQNLQQIFEQRKAANQPVGNVLGRVFYYLAQISLMQADFRASIALAQKSIAELGNSNNRVLTARSLLLLGRIYLLEGADVAVQAYADMALNTAKTSMASAEIALAFQLKGEIYQGWGKADQALVYFQDALKLAEELKLPAAIELSILLAQTHLSLNQTKPAKTYLTQAEAILSQQKDLFLKYKSHLGLAVAYTQLAEYALALPHFKAARKGFQELGLAYYQAQALFGMAELNSKNGQGILADYQAALSLAETVPANKFLGVYGSTLGQELLSQGQVKEAIPILEKGLAGLTYYDNVSTDALREVTEKIIPTYHALIDAHLKLAQTQSQDYLKLRAYQAAFLELEASKSAVLLKSLKGWSNSVGLENTEQIFRSSDVRNFLPAQTAAISYAQTSDRSLAQFAIQRKGFQAQSLDLRQLLEKDPIYLKYAESLRLNVDKKPDFSRLCQVYRQLLSNPKSDLKTAHDLGHLLYRLLIAPQADFLGDSKKLLIIPDGVLGLVPFETLRDNQGKYLVESFDIQYIQSFDILAYLSGSSRNYDKQRKPLLAMGGANYESVNYSSDPIESAAEFLNLKRQIWQAPEGPMREIYGALYGPQWQPLPGSLKEIQAIQKLVPDAVLIHGEKVAEPEIKALSAAGQLAQYKVLHWAVHGLTVPEIPELSALVLSQTTEPQAEDNYLRMPEIAKLKLKADFVNLSACETGLGKIFRGEGVVGLTQSFLIAGANRVSVSLWQISDAGTAQFMPAFYAKLDKGYAQSLNQTKREFLQGKYGANYKHPYYWSPFVLYGKF